MVGQSWKIPVSGRASQPFEPPPQFNIPDAPMRDMPIITMTVPTPEGLGLAQKGAREMLTGNHGRKDTLENARRHEGETHLKE